jgi:hypothetical protein
MSEAIANLINRADPEAFFGIVIAVGGAFLVAIVGIIVWHWYKWRKREIDANLKLDMLARGMSAEDIERVLSAGTAPAEFRKWWNERRSVIDTTLQGVKRP